MSDFVSILSLYKSMFSGFFAIPLPFGENFPLTVGNMFIGIIGVPLFINVLRMVFSNHSED